VVKETATTLSRAPAALPLESIPFSPYLAGFGYCPRCYRWFPRSKAPRAKNGHPMCPYCRSPLRTKPRNNNRRQGPLWRAEPCQGENPVSTAEQLIEYLRRAVEVAEECSNRYLAARKRLRKVRKYLLQAENELKAARSKLVDKGSAEMHLRNALKLLRKALEETAGA